MSERSYFWKTAQGLLRVFSTLMFDLKTYDRQNLPKTGGVLLVANHQSYLDPVVLAVQLNRPVSYMAKSELFVNRIFGWAIRKVDAFPVRQGEGDIGALREVIRQLAAGHVVGIFPEGGRTETGEIQPLEKGVALVIRKAGVPVVPVAIDGSFVAWPKANKLFRSHPIRVLYGKPVNLHELKNEQIIRELETRLRSLLCELRSRPFD